MKVLNVKLSEIKNVTENYRLKESENDVSDLMASIKKTGLLNPVTVKAKAGGGYTLLAGFRRFRAVKKLKLGSIPINVVSSDLSQNMVNLVENMQRENTSSYEIGRGIYLSMKKDDLTSSEVAVLLGIPKSTVTTYLSLYKNTPVAFRSKVKSSTTGGSAGRTIGTVSNSTAAAIINLKKKGAITAKQTNQLFTTASKDPSVNANRIRAMAINGINTTQNLTNGNSVKYISVSFRMTTSQFKKLGSQPHDAIRNAASKALKIKLL